MAHDVFISHNRKDQAAADAVCAVLEASGIGCWITSRDIKLGENRTAANVRARKYVGISLMTIFVAISVEYWL